LAKNKIQGNPYSVSAINNAVLNYDVYVMSASEKFLYRLMCFALGGIVGMIFYGGLFKSDGVATVLTYISNFVVFVVAGLITGKIAMPLLNERLRTRRFSKLKSQFRDFLVALSTSLSSGMNVNNALLNACKDLETQYSPEAYIVKEVKEMIDCIRNNVSFEESLKNFGERSCNDDIINFSTVFSTCLKTGGNLKEVVRRTSDIISEKMVIAEEIETKLTSNKMQMNVMMVIPIFIVLMMKNMSSDFAESLTSAVGVIAITVALGIFVAAYKVGQKVMTVKG
jgi:tight adherence protein B